MRGIPSELGPILRDMNAQTALLAPVEPPDGIHEPVEGPALRFEVEGEHVAQGSFKAMISHTTGFAMIKADNESALKRWRKLVAGEAIKALPPWLLGPEGEPAPHDGPVFVSLIFARARSERDYLADGVTLRKGARRYPDTAPDSDKLERAIFDALTGIVFTNDGRVVSNVTLKRYCQRGESERVIIEVVPL
jgi:Holliday junction resolvase RusA-like endonuclease